MLRSKQSRQAIYSGKRAIRTTVPSLQELCIEKLKDNIEGKSKVEAKHSARHGRSIFFFRNLSEIHEYVTF